VTLIELLRGLVSYNTVIW